MNVELEKTARADTKCMIEDAYKNFDNMLKHISSVHEWISKLYASKSKDGKPNKQLEELINSLEISVTGIDEYKCLFGDLIIEHNREVLKKSEENMILKNRTEQLEREIEALREENNSLKKQLEANNSQMTGIVRGYEVLLRKLNQQMESFNSRVNSAVNQIACKEYMQSEGYKSKDRKGANASAYRQDIDVEELKKEYQSGRSVKQLAQKYNMTENGMRSRLKSLGVWEDRRSNKNKKI